MMESLEAPWLVSPTAYRYGISRSLLMAWCRALKVEHAAPDPAPAFVPAVLIPEPAAEAKAAPLRSRSRMHTLSMRPCLRIGTGDPPAASASMPPSPADRDDREPARGDRRVPARVMPLGLHSRQHRSVSNLPQRQGFGM